MFGGMSYIVCVAVALGMGRRASGGERSLERLAGAGSQRPFMPRNLNLIVMRDEEAFEGLKENYARKFGGKP